MSEERKRGSVLVVDDEAYVRESLTAMLESKGFRVQAACSVAEALAPEAMAGVDVVVTDLKMPEEDGLVLVSRLAEQRPSLPVVVLTGHGTVKSAVDCMRSGAFDYVLKPTDPDELSLVLQRALGHSDLRRELDYLRSGMGEMPRRRGPIGRSEAWQQVLELVEVAAPADTSVLLLGESGTGKEEVARLLHNKSRRAGGPFVRVNCAAIPAELFESEFFGHRRGSFTGAVADREGRFRIAHGGTLLLDEINSLPSVAQAKVLRVLQDGSFERVGDSNPTFVDVRVVCASNTDVKALVEAGSFRADLYYRINVMTISIPPLRERRSDIPLLAEAFIQEFATRLGKPVTGIDEAAMDTLIGYSWPGNVRELRNVIERGVLLEKTETLRLESLPSDLLGSEEPRDEGALDLKAALAAKEKRLLEEALEASDGVRREAARLLGVDERNLAYYLKKHGLMDAKKRGKGD